MNVDLGAPAVGYPLRVLLDDLPDIAELEFFEATPVPLLQQRLGGGDAELEITRQALGLRDSYQVPFWDALLLSCFGRGSSARTALAEARFHNSKVRQVNLDAAECSAERLDEMGTTAESAGRFLVVSSRVRLRNDSIAHVPMLDFHCPTSPENLQLAKAVVELLGMKSGFLVQSGKSYHFYGSALLTEEALPAFLGRALLFSPIIDRAWIAHQLIEGACGLRISSRPGEATRPSVVARVHPVSSQTTSRD